MNRKLCAPADRAQSWESIDWKKAEAYERILFCLLWDKLSQSGKKRPGVSFSTALRSDRHSPPTI